MTSARLLVVMLLAAGPFSSAQAVAQVVAPLPAQSSRWNQLDEQERARIRQRFEQFQALQVEQRTALEARHEMLEQLRDRALEELPDQERARFQKLKDKERRRAERKATKAWLKRTRSALDGELRAADLDPSQVPFSDIRTAMRNYAAERLYEMEEAGLLEAGEADVFLDMTPRQLREAIAKVQQRHKIRKNPKVLRDLPPAERRRITELSPAEFRRALRKLRGKESHLRVPQEVRDRADTPASPPLPRSVVESYLTDGQRLEVAALKGRERRQAVARALKDNAFQAMRDRGEDPGAMDRMRQRGTGRLEEVIRLIDPTFRPPAAPIAPDDQEPGRGPRSR